MSDMQLRVKILEAQGLSRADRNGTSDPFVVAKFRGLGKMMAHSAQTAVIHNTTNPVWNQELTLYPKTASDVLLLKVYDHDTLTKDNLLGMIELPLDRFFQTGFQEQWVQLMKRKGSWKALVGGHPTFMSVPGILHFQIWFGMSAQATGLAPQVASIPQTFVTGQASTLKDIHDPSATFSTGYNPIVSPYSSQGMQAQQQGMTVGPQQQQPLI
eukprot:TRINITY_DN527_c0_g1_i1.p1 TRINITY_DN527_c0_g1~~TRINITY_DN527_c0_g1_i1.p1  ORF type:complete len:213 (+),score=45.74 TRINITY_DN527_c0_g1_i1:97-735(+)